MRTPYNTGKIKIGEFYEPPPYVEEDRDMIAIQGWFLGDNRVARRNYYANLSYCVLLAVAIIVGVIYA